MSQRSTWQSYTTPTHIPLEGATGRQGTFICHLLPSIGVSSGKPPVFKSLWSLHCKQLQNSWLGTEQWAQATGASPFSLHFLWGGWLLRSRKSAETNTQILQTDARGKEMNAELFNNMEREILIAAFHKTTSLLPSPSLEKVSQFCFYISHPQGRTIPTSPCAHLHHQPCHNISKSYMLRLPRKRTAITIQTYTSHQDHLTMWAEYHLLGRSGDRGQASPHQISPISYSPVRSAEHQGFPCSTCTWEVPLIVHLRIPQQQLLTWAQVPSLGYWAVLISSSRSLYWFDWIFL